MLTSHVQERCGRKRLTKIDVKLHEKAHIKFGDIKTDVEYVPRQVEELRLHSDLPLYSLILQHDGLDLINKVRGHESLKEILDEDGLSKY